MIRVDADVVDVVNVLPCEVEYVIPLIYKVEPRSVDKDNVLPKRVENIRVLPLVIGADKVETLRLLP